MSIFKALRLYVSELDQLAVLCLGLFIIYSFLGVLSGGYGNHVDIYGILNTWRQLSMKHVYVPSRYQGCLVPELIIGAFSQIGGYAASNTGSALASSASLYFFGRLLKRVTASRAAVLAVAAVGLNPTYIIVSSHSMDVIYGLFFFLFAAWLLNNKQHKLSGLFLAMSGSCRIEFIPIGMTLLCFPLFHSYTKKYSVASSVFAILFMLFFTGIFFVPVFIASNKTLSFISNAGNPWSLSSNLARYVYKNIYLFGFPACLVVAYCLYQQISLILNGLIKQEVGLRKDFIYFCLFVLAYNQAVFIKLPHQFYYLMPSLFSIAALVAIMLSKSVRLLMLLTISHIFYCVLSIQFLSLERPIVAPGEAANATGAKLEIKLVSGLLVQDFLKLSTEQDFRYRSLEKQWQKQNLEEVK